MTFEDHVRTTLSARQLIGDDASILVAASGGPDSTALLLALSALRSALGLRLAVCTVDHGLRPEAKDEARFVKDVARAHEIPFVLEELGVPPRGHAEARRSRYAALERVRARLGLADIATAHTRTDQAETVLIRLLRGTGLAGLSAIQPRHGRVIRPLLDVGRTEVEAYLVARDVRACADPSNVDRKTLRARVRQDLWPILVREAPRIERTLASLADEALAVARPGSADPLAEKGRALRVALKTAGLRAERRHVDAILRMLRVLPR